ncbi:MAG: sigma-54-dependent Fis family transcriptional regulator [Desulfovibrionaceae bacterium]|nr:sigma-54-dependent Fis family transcriptional regulator [Desulfovibrionaceae bacterium]
MSRDTILIIDDDLGIQYALGRMVEKLGHAALLAGSLEQGRALVSAHAPAVIFLDIFLPDGNGVEALPDFCAGSPLSEIIMITGLGSQDEAERALLAGAYDFISKNTPMEELGDIVAQALERHRAKRADREDPGIAAFGEALLVGGSTEFRRSVNLARQFSETDSNVLLLGETGTGKELFAETIHANSARRDHPFVPVDCASLPENLAPSILFGHARGAFTSASSSREGLMAKADKGTLFLDEIGELPLETQKVFLRVLQERRFRPVGGTREQPCDFRLIAATNQDLQALSEQGAFRKDLYYRLQTCVITLPGLRRRGDDVLVLAERFVRDLCEKEEQAVKVCSELFLKTLRMYPWRGNVRELRNAMEFAVAAARNEDELCVHHLPDRIRIFTAKYKFIQASKGGPAGQDCREAALSLADSTRFPGFTEYKETMGAQLEREYMRTVHSVAHGDIRAMMELTKLSRSRCYALVKQYVAD